jgi:large conductance mechanosensitive channel
LIGRDFRAFIARGNIVDLAVAVVIGGAFGTVVKSFVDDVIMPPIGLALGSLALESYLVRGRGAGDPKDSQALTAAAAL